MVSRRDLQVAHLAVLEPSRGCRLCFVIRRHRIYPPVEVGLVSKESELTASPPAMVPGTPQDVQMIEFLSKRMRPSRQRPLTTTGW